MAELLAERHGKVGLVVAEFCILSRADHIEQRGSFGGVGQEGLQGGSKSVFESSQDVHGCSVVIDLSFVIGQQAAVTWGATFGSFFGKLLRIKTPGGVARLGGLCPNR